MKNPQNQAPIKAPETEDAATKNVAIYVLTTGVIGSITLAIVNIDRPEMSVLGGVYLASLILLLRGYTKTGKWTSLLATLGLFTFLAFQNLGIRDMAVPGLLVVLIAAGLLSGRIGTIVIGASILIIITSMGYLESQGFFKNRLSSFNSLTDYLTLSLIVIITTVFQWLTITRHHQSIKLSKLELFELEETQKRLQEAETRYKNLVERIPAVIYMAETGEQGRWHYVSPYIQRLTGYTAEEWLTDPDLWFNLIHPDDRTKTIQNEVHGFESGEMPKLEYRLRTKDGGYIWIYDESLVALDSDKQTLIQGFLLDVTERKTAEEELKKRHSEIAAMRGVSESIIARTELRDLIRDTGEQIRITFDVSNIFIAILDPYTNMIHFPYDYYNNGLQEDEPITLGEGMTSKVMEMKKPIVINSDWKRVSGQYNAIYRNIREARSSLIAPMLIRDTAIGAISLDDTERENAFTENDVRLLSTIAANLAVAIDNARLHDSLKRELAIQERLVHELELKNAELERFTYTASHDLKSPLITIRGYLGYLERDALDGNTDRLRKDIQRISEATEKMHRLLNDLLELSRIGHVMNKTGQVPFAEVVIEALKRVEGQLNAKRIKIQIQEDLPIVFGDKERLVEVMQNLLDNASKFTGDREDPRIEIGTLQRELEIKFYVRDNGIGINKVYHEKVFGLFNKLDPDSEGTGVGLALVKRIIETHGGKIWIESEGEGTGTTFLFTLPSREGSPNAP